MCSVTGCTGTFHHTLLHPERVRKPNNVVAESSKTTSNVTHVSENDNSATVTSCSLSDSNAYDKSSENVYLCVHENKSVNTYAFLDQGSTRSFCDKSLIDLLGASGSTEEVTLQTITGAQSHQGQTVSLCVEFGKQ